MNSIPPLVHVDPSELAQLRAEIDRTQAWVKKRQRSQFWRTTGVVALSYAIMIVTNLLVFAILAAIIPPLRNGPWYAYLLLMVPPICALPPFLPLVVGIAVGVPLRRRIKREVPFFMGA